MNTQAINMQATYRKIGWHLIPLLILCYISAYIDRSNIGFAKLQFMGDLGMSEAAFGLGAGLFYLGYSLFEIPSNLMLAKIGARRTMMRILLLWSLVSAATAFITTEMHYYVLRLVLGAAEAGFFPGVLFYLSQWAPASQRARFTALFMSAMPLSGIVGGPISGGIMRGMDGYQGMAGWQWLFMVEGLPGCLLAVVVYYYLKDKPSDAKWLTTEEKAAVMAELAAENAVKRDSTPGSFAEALRDKRIYMLAGMAVGLISGIGGIALWLPSIIRRTGIADPFHIGLLSALPFIAAVIVQQWVARRSDRRQERRKHAAVCALVGALGWMLLPLAQGQPVASLALMTLTAAGTFGATGPFWALPASYLRGTAAAGGIALITTFGSIAGFISPIIVGWAATRTGTLSFGQLYYAALMIIGAMLLLCIKPTAKTV